MIARETAAGGKRVVGYVMAVPPVGIHSLCQLLANACRASSELRRNREWACDGPFAAHETKSSARV